jgi:hypothetical protein
LLLHLKNRVGKISLDEDTEIPGRSPSGIRQRWGFIKRNPQVMIDALVANLKDPNAKMNKVPQRTAAKKKSASSEFSDLLLI